MKILLFGKNGQVGFELQRALATLGEVKALDSKELDITNSNALRNCISKYNPDFIINAAAYTAVDKAENNKDLVYRINVKAVKVMAEEAKLCGALLVHYSTDYVFDGKKSSPYIETDITKPISIYGVSKKAGEESIEESGCKYIIIRTSWVYEIHGTNFAKTILRLANERDNLSIVADQFGVPTKAEMVADVTSLMLYRICYDLEVGKNCVGIYNLVPSGRTSWYEFAVSLIKEAISQGMELKCSVDKIMPINTSQYPLPAVRPANSCLDTSKLTKKFDITFQDWEYYSKRFISQIIVQKITQKVL